MEEKKLYKRTLEDQIKGKLFEGKIIVIYGPRQVGKTTLAKKIILDSGKKYKFLSGENVLDREVLSYSQPEKIKAYFGDVDIVLIDEAHFIPNIGRTMKVYYDSYNEIQIVATGSSSFNLKDKVAEAMTGRYWSFMLYPLSIEEITGKDNLYDFKRLSDQDFSLKFGMYPYVINTKSQAKEYLETLVESTLYKDVFVMQGIKKSEILSKLVKILAINISQTVTVGGLAKMVNTSPETIRNYLDLLEKTFVTKIMYSFSRNLNNELKRAMKVYFVDIGFRNAVIQNFNDYDTRTDIGQVFENFWVMERIKYTNYNRMYSNKYFWQTYNDIEIDYLEESGGELKAFECKWTQRKSKGVKLFEEEYKKEKASVTMVTKENYLDYLK